MGRAGWLLLFLYLIFQPLYPLLPPFLGVVFVLWQRAVNRHDKFASWSLILYTLVFESLWGLPLGGLWLMMYVVHRWGVPFIGYYIRRGLAIELFSVLLFDLAYLGALFFIDDLFLMSVVDFSYIFLYYIVMDLLGLLLV